MSSFGIVTPTIGTEFLRQCIESVRGQDCIHYIWVDGEQYHKKVDDIIDTCWHDRLRVNYLHENVGRTNGNWYGHRIYAACSFLLNTDYVSFLDEDNWVEPNHIESLRGVFLENKYDWVYCLRKIVDPDGQHVCDDNFESLGLWPVTGDPNRYHIDTGCFAVPRDLVVKVGNAWMGEWGQDRVFFAALKKVAPNFGCTTQHTLNYRLGGSTSRATSEMFLQGNRITAEVYGREYPWHTQRKKNLNPSQLVYHTTNQNRSL